MVFLVCGGTRMAVFAIKVCLEVSDVVVVLISTRSQRRLCVGGVGFLSTDHVGVRCCVLKMMSIIRRRKCAKNNDEQTRSIKKNWQRPSQHFRLLAVSTGHC